MGEECQTTKAGSVLRRGGAVIALASGSFRSVPGEALSVANRLMRYRRPSPGYSHD